MQMWKIRRAIKFSCKGSSVAVILIKTVFVNISSQETKVGFYSEVE